MRPWGAYTVLAEGDGFKVKTIEVPLVFVEVQHGDYFGEDDIVRLEDDYGRLPGEQRA